MKCILACILAVATLAQAMPGARIVGGDEAKPNQFPYQVGLNLFLENGQVSFCGGSLISNRYVLTAAHCTQTVEKMEVVMGAHKVNDESESTQVRMNTSIIIPHEKWYPTMLLNDIAVVKLPKAVEFNKYISSIRLPTTDSTDYAGTKAIVSGWGKTSDQSNSMSPILRYVSNDIITEKKCQELYPKVIHETHMCSVGDAGRSFCNGDSGGPLVLEQNGSKVQVGIVSFGWKTCETGHPAVYTRITKYLDWIKKNAEL